LLFRCRDISPYRSSTKSENRSQVNFLTKISRDPGSLFLPMLHKTKTRLRLSIPDASKAVYLLTPDKIKNRTLSAVFYFVGVPRYLSLQEQYTFSVNSEQVLHLHRKAFRFSSRDNCLSRLPPTKKQ